ncbi:MAG: hypothetical protein LBC03_01365 [Nitrososphaerota archaeon]|nr:hypothetical protein [Nitrososphaerota archaeon]
MKFIKRISEYLKRDFYADSNRGEKKSGIEKDSEENDYLDEQALYDEMEDEGLL